MKPVAKPDVRLEKDLDPEHPRIVFSSQGNASNTPLDNLHALHRSKHARQKNTDPVLLVPAHGQTAPYVVAPIEQNRPDKARIAAAQALKLLQNHQVETCIICLPDTDCVTQQAIVEGALSANHVFVSKGPAKSKVQAVAHLEFAASKITDTLKQAVHHAWLSSIACLSARDLATEPANVLTPDAFAARCKTLAKHHGLGIKTMERAELEQEGMGGILAVAAASAYGAYLIQIDWTPKDASCEKPVVLVGKTVTFDTGGISIKSANEMDHMKADMGGGAAVFGLMQMIPELAPDFPVTALFAVVENMPGSKAMRPSDVIRTASGKTVEIINTDAEGRLILADALHVASQLNPRVVIDFATLTGATMGIFGPLGIGTFSNDDTWFAKLQQADALAQEQVWRLPLWDQYLDFLKSPVADLRNFSLLGQNGSTPTAAAFLSQFVGEHPWMHLDLYNSCWNASDNNPLMPLGPTGSGARVAAQMLINLTQHTRY